MDLKEKITEFMTSEVFFNFLDNCIDNEFEQARDNFFKYLEKIRQSEYAEFENIVIDFVSETEVLFIQIGHKYTVECFRNSNINFFGNEKR